MKGATAAFLHALTPERVQALAARGVQLVFTATPNEECGMDGALRLANRGLRADAVMALWRDFAGQALSGASPVPGFETVPIYYNRLITEPAYRRALSATLGIRDGVRGLDGVTSYGHGSSFSGTAQLDTKGLFERWKHYEADPLFRRLFEDGRAEDLTRRLAAA